MEDVLDLYSEPYDSKRPVVCFDETSKQLVAEKQSPIPAKAGRRERFDYEYQRNGTRNLQRQFADSAAAQPSRNPLATLSCNVQRLL